ncbi:ExeM/NucH family extracellular endonuclease [Arcanobacterium bovis]|nr:ExeM/NucH family extracellular endonuclease [Arcanobacterium bovis]
MRKKLMQLAGLTVAAGLVVPFGTSISEAAPAGSYSTGASIVISEVYVRGGSSDARFRDYVELYNPTDKDISLDGMSIQYFTKDKLSSSNSFALHGKIAPKGYFLLVGKAGNSGTESPLKADQETTLNASASAATIVLAQGTQAQTLFDGDQSANTGVIDTFGWGATKSFEGKAHKAQTAGGTSNQRADGGIDTNDNSVDFSVKSATPQYSGGDATGASGNNDPKDPSSGNTDSTNLPVDIQEVTIAQVQGSGSQSPLQGQKVKTQGVVTGVYPTGGFDGIYIQTPGTGGKNDDGVSDGLFVYSKTLAQSVKIGDYISVVGEVNEYYSLTQLKAMSWEKLEKTAEVVDPVPVVIDAAPTEEADREALEGMLIAVTGTHTVTNNYDTNKYGQVGLAIGAEPLIQPTEMFNPSENPIGFKAMSEANAKRKITLDDGSSWSYFGSKYKNDLVPVPYLNVKDPLRVGAHVTFKKPMILDFRYQWNYQPTEPVNVMGADDPNSYVDNSKNWITISNNKRPAAPGNFGGDVTVSSFNVLNYFVSLGAQEAKCQGWPDRKGEPITANKCSVRGAYTEAAMKRQQTKIVAAINALDSTIIGLEEIENSAKYGKPRDTALDNLVRELNKAAGYDKWTRVASPSAVPQSEDVIRLAYIYQSKNVKPVGESKILIGNEFISGFAREPLAQEWQGVNARGEGFGQTFVTVVNHLKSKGSQATKIPNDVDKGQGKNNLLRVEQAKAMLAWVEQNFAQKPVFILGDMNSYTEEDPLRTIENKGYVSIAKKYNVKNHSYQFSGIIGSLDHGFANPAGEKMLVGADVWNVNAMEPAAFEYSNYNMNVKVNDLFDTTPYRSSDHDPIKFALKLGKVADVPNADDATQCVKPMGHVSKVFPNTKAIEDWGKKHPNNKFGMKKAKKNNGVATHFCGFTPNSPVKFYFYTDAKLIGESTTTATGEIAFDFAVPAVAEPGLHYVVAYSEVDSSVAAMQVLVEPATAAGAGGADASATGTAGVGGSMSGDGNRLATTGSDNLTIALSGIVLALVGASLVSGIGFARRKK